jgi:hypothetical protein
MTEFTKKKGGVELMKGVMLYSLIIVFLGLGGQEVPLNIHSQSTVYSVDANQSSSEVIYNFDSFSSDIFFVDFEIEEQEDDDDHHYSDRKSSQPLSLPLLVLNKITSSSLFLPKKIIKLYILFHSWKSFLYI